MTVIFSCPWNSKIRSKSVFPFFFFKALLKIRLPHMFYIFSSFAGAENTFGQSLCFLKLNSALLPIQMNSFQKQGIDKSSSKYRPLWILWNLWILCHVDDVLPCVVFQFQYSLSSVYAPFPHFSCLPWTISKLGLGSSWTGRLLWPPLHTLLQIISSVEKSLPVGGAASL